MDDPGNLSTFGIVTGIEFAFGESRRDGEDALELIALLEADCSGLPSSVGNWGTILEELNMVVSTGLADCSLISICDDAAGGVAGIGTCSIVSLELLPDGKTDIGGGFRFLLGVVSDDVDDSKEGLLLPSRYCALVGLGFEIGDFVLAFEDTGRPSEYGVSPRCNLASTSRSVT